MKNTKELLGGRIRELRKGLKMSQVAIPVNPTEETDVMPTGIPL